MPLRLRFRTTEDVRLPDIPVKVEPIGPHCKICGAPVHKVGTAYFHDAATAQLATIAREVEE